MDKALFFFIVFALIAGNFLIDTMDELDASDESSKRISSRNKPTYMVKDSSGEIVLLIDSLSIKDQNEAWKTSPVKTKVSSYFPNIEKMKQYIDINVGGSIFKIRLLREIDIIGEEYSSGEIDFDTAKEKLNLNISK